MTLKPKNKMELRIAGKVKESIVDGRGIRFVVFTQGCPHRCPDCHNPDTHSFEGGEVVLVDDLFEEIKDTKMISGVTFSGGEPFCQCEPLIYLAERIRAETKLNITAFSGYTFEELQSLESSAVQLLRLCDTLIDGRFEKAQKDLTLHYRGSRNQRVIDVPASLKEGRAVEV